MPATPGVTVPQGPSFARHLMVTPKPRKPLGFWSANIDTAKNLATILGSAIPANALYALIMVEAQTARWRDDGTAPTASVGFLLQINTLFSYEGDLSTIQFIGSVAGATLRVSLYGEVW